MNLKKTIFSIFLSSCFGFTYAQQTVTLHIGDEAPQLSYSKWIKGEPVDIATNDKINVVEFWATWCGPCIAAMPHLSELAAKYADKAVFIGCNVLEGAHSSNKKKYEEYLPNVMRFVNSSANRMSYHVIADNNNEDMYHNWLQAAGLEGIPQTFVIKANKILWIGNPVDLDQVMEGIVKGNFDIANNKKTSEDKAAQMRELSARITSGYQAVIDAAAAKDFDKALKLIEENPVKELNMVLKVEKFNILLKNFNEEDAFNYARELNKENRSYATMIGSAISEQNELSKNAYRFGAASFLSVSPSNCLITDKAALCYSKAGDFKAAVDTELKAIELAKVEAKDPKFAGRVFDYTAKDFEVRLNEYRKSLN